MRNYLRVYSWIISFIKPFRKYLYIYVILCLFISTSQLSIPYYIQLLTDHVMPSKNMQQFMNNIIVLFGLLLVLLILNVFKNMISVKFQEHPSKDMLFKIYHHILNLGYPFYEHNSVGDSLSLMTNDVGNVQKLYREFIPNFIQTFIMCFIYFTYLLYINVTLSLILMSSFVIYYLFAPYFERKAALYGRKAVLLKNEANSMSYNSLSSIIELRAGGFEQYNLQRLIQKFGMYNRTNILFLIFQNAKGGVRRVFIYLGLVFLYYYAFTLIINGTLSVGEFLVFNLVYVKVMFELTRLITQITEQRIIFFQAEKLYDLYHTPAAVTEQKNPVTVSTITGKFELRNLSFSYPNGQHVIRSLSCVFNHGEHVAIVGKSGCGKSTLIKLLGRFYDSQNGEILLDQIPLQQYSLTQLRENIGYAFQDIMLFNATIKDNIRFGNPSATDQDIIIAAQIANAHHFIMEYPDGYDTLISERGSNLSGGQRQRISLARTLVKKSPVIIMDETSSALDNASEQIINHNLRHYLRDRTVLKIAHRTSTIVNSDRILVMDKGSIVEEGTYNELISRRGHFYEIMQVRGTE